MCEKRHIWRGRGPQKKSAPPAKVERSYTATDTLAGGAPERRPAVPCAAIVAQAPENVKPQRRKSRSGKGKGDSPAGPLPAAATMKGARADGRTDPTPGGAAEGGGPQAPQLCPALPGAPSGGGRAGGGRGEPKRRAWVSQRCAGDQRSCSPSRKAVAPFISIEGGSIVKDFSLLLLRLRAYLMPADDDEEGGLTE
jgi:hypothetical protein